MASTTAARIPITPLWAEFPGFDSGDSSDASWTNSENSSTGAPTDQDDANGSPLPSPPSSVASAPARLVVPSTRAERLRLPPRQQLYGDQVAVSQIGLPIYENDAYLFQIRRVLFEETQRRFPGSACVFVGNLPAQLRDIELVELLESIFRTVRHGVDVRRTFTPHEVRPWALLQFPNDAMADMAIVAGAAGITIAGRPLRVARSRAWRHLHVARRDGGFIPYDELMSEMGAFGEMEAYSYVASPRPVAMVRYRTYGAYLLARREVRGGNTPYLLL